MIRAITNAMANVAAIALAAGASLPLHAALCTDDAGPRAAVESYITAMKAYQFEQAYEFLTGNMHDDQPVNDWSKLQLAYFVGGEVRLARPDARPAHAVDGAADCADKAIVPHVLRAKDKFNNQGSTEFELYTVVRDGDRWLIDSQETLFDEEAIERWFPDEPIPTYREQL